MHKLRQYQRDAIDAVYAYWREGGGNPLIELATGCGKSLLAASLCKELLETWPQLRIGVITHVKELIAQNAQEMIYAWPGAPVGVYSAGLGRRDMRAKILFCGIQSVHDKAARLGGFDVLIIDEAHLCPRNADTMYGRFIRDCRTLIPDMRIVGMSATPYRLDSGRLDAGDSALFDEVVYRYGIGEGVRDGFLAPLVSKATLTEINTDTVPVRGGEFVPLDLQTMAVSNVKPACEELVRLGNDRRAWLIFATGVSHAWEIAKEIRGYGVGAVEVVSGETPAGDRDRIIAAYRAGNIRCLVNVNVLTTGFNVPQVDLIGWMRPTLSTGLYVQGCGRGTRQAPDKTDCLVLDWAGNGRRHGPVDLIDIKDKKSDSGRVKPETVRGKYCPDCVSLVGASALKCQYCDYEWPRKTEPKHDARADANSSVMASAPPKWLQVVEVEFNAHPAKPEKPPTLRAEYRCGIAVHKEWVCFEHLGFAREKAIEWWRAMGGNWPTPALVEEALARIDELDWPREICVKPDGKFFRIVGRKLPPRHEKNRLTEDQIMTLQADLKRSGHYDGEVDGVIREEIRPLSAAWSATWLLDDEIPF